MTPTEIDALPAGRELDALVAERVMGWTNISTLSPQGRYFGARHFGWHETLRGSVPEHGRVALPSYSTDIAAGWEVVEKLVSLGWHFTITSLQGKWHAGLTKDIGDVRETAMGHESTVPLAICRAALKAVLTEPPAPR